MKRTISNELKNKVGKKVLVKGWLHSLRMLGAVNFLMLRDRGGFTQVVIESRDELNKVKDLQPGSVLAIEAEVQKSLKTSLGVELVSPSIVIEVPVKYPLPLDISKKELSANLDTILDYRSLVLRNEKQMAIFKIQASIIEAFAHSMKAQGFTRFDSPVLMGSPSESGADVFEVKYFGDKAYLAQSPQIYKQIMVGVFERVYTIAKVFRAEKHNTSRHLMEITQLDGEMGFIENYDEVLEVVEKVVRDIFTYLEINNPIEIEVLSIQLPQLPEGGFPRIKVKEALTLIEQRTGKSANREELDVDPEDEREITEWAKEEHNSEFVWLLNFKSNKNFYTLDNPEDKGESFSYDLLCRGLEWLSGTHRIHNYSTLLERLKNQGLQEEHYSHYLQAFKYGMPSEAGFSFGLERVTQQIVGLDNIREATLFPSDQKRIAGARIKRKVVHGEEEVIRAIKTMFEESNKEYRFFEHEATITSQDAARIRGTNPDEGVKALILRSKKDGRNIMLCLQGSKKIDMGKLKNLLGESFTFEEADKIKQRYGLEIGGIPPFGNILGLETYFDSSILNTEYVSFNCGSRYKSIRTKTNNLAKLVSPQIVDVV